MNRFVLCFGVVLSACLLIGSAAGPDDQFVEVYRLIKQADDLSETGQPRAAYDKYMQARKELQALQKGAPAWNPKIIQFRLNYVAEKLAVIEKRSPEVKAAPAASLAVTPLPPVEAAVHDQQMRALREEIQRLTADKNLLEAKLREALSAQPAAVDPREVTKAEERTRALQKENELLKLAVEQAKAAAPTPVPAPTISEREKLEAIRKENDILKSQLAEVRAAGGNPAKVEDLSRQLKLAKAELDTQKAANDNLRKEQRGLEKQLEEAQKAVKSGAAKVADLEKEKSDLDKKLARRLAAPGGNKSDEVEQINRLLADKEKLEKQLAGIRENSRASQTALDQLKKENAQLQAKLDDESKAQTKARQADLERIKRLEKDRDALQNRLDSLAKAKPGSRAEKRLTEEVTVLRSKVEVLEAKKVPFTPEELALFKEPATGLNLVTAETKPAAPAKTKLSPEAGMLIAEAQRAFNSKRYEEAEKKYQDVLKQDNRNATSLYNLAVIQMEQGRLDEAEVNLRNAVAEAAEDGHNWSLMGILKFRQKKYDEALEALSRAAKIDPNNSETQNYLGITLSEKGQRVPAEAALRKAIQISPGYGSAHHNLAIIYATQKPPFTELARWHYQKATSSGHPRNPELEKILDGEAPKAN